MRQVLRWRSILTIVLWSICSCQFYAKAQQVQSVADRAYKAGVLHQIDSLLEWKYVLPEKAKEYAAAFHKAWSSGVYDSLSNAKAFAKTVTADLIGITQDQHIQFRVIEPSDIGEEPESALHHPLRYYHLRIKENTGFSRLEWMEGNIGYLDFRRFNLFPEARAMIVAAMTFLSHANAIILDLRENGGGSGDYLSSYFLSHPTQLTGWYSREDDFLTEFWTSREIGVERQTEIPLFILTSKRTFSAAESFAYDMKVRNRATLIGESTKGGAHSVDLYKVGTYFELYLPTSRAVNPVTGGNWEGTGVIPDIAVPATVALDTALVLAKAAGDAFGKGKNAKLKRAVDEMQILMEHAERFYRADQPHAGKAALDSLFSIGKTFNLITEFFVGVLAYNFLSKEDEQIQYAILQKNIEFFPQSPTAYETLAYAFFKNGRKEQAIENYQKVQALEPDNRNAANMIKHCRQK